MCGLIGAVGNRLDAKVANFMTQGLIVDTVRGVHSTGLLTVLKDQGAEWYKDSVDGYSFVTLPTVKDMLKDHFSRQAYLGHNRAATVGAVDRKNAHPFREDNIILMHNGTLRHTLSLPQGDKFDVDSHAIAYSISEIGAEATIKELTGAFALVWYDLKTRTVNFVRNEERPLHMGQVKESSQYVKDNVWLYGSELGMLKWLASRNGMEVENWFSLKPGVLMSFDMEEKQIKPTYKEVDYKKPVKFTDNWGDALIRRNKNKNKDNKAPAYNPPSNHETLYHYTDGKLWKGKKVLFWPEQFVYYNKASSSRGRIIGYMSDDPFHQVVVHGVLAEDFDTKKQKVGKNTWYVLPEGQYEAPALSVFKGPNPKKDHIVLQNKVELVELYNSKEDKKSGDKKKDKKVVKLSEVKGEEKKEEAPEDYVKGPRGVLISKKEWSKLTQDGCCCCSRNFYEEDIENIYWIDTKSPVCAKCADDNDMSMCMS